ncbi:FG-GAP repeat domain-containing protein [Thermomonas carbonis]|uniref:FG-GAP repeat domain-containing protein n=1 Tax=Thermomonas carbonis TaxID=1463158 RepID=UPI003CCD94B7
MLGDGDGGIETQERYELPGFGNDVAYTLKQGHANALALGDLNGDGCADLAAATFSGVTILHGCKPKHRSLPLVDFDGDGVTDLYWRHKTNGLAWIWLWGTRMRPASIPARRWWIPPGRLASAISMVTEPRTSSTEAPRGKTTFT